MKLEVGMSVEASLDGRVAEQSKDTRNHYGNLMERTQFSAYSFFVSFVLLYSRLFILTALEEMGLRAACECGCARRWG